MGEYPSSNDMIAGKPFSKFSGDVLWTTLAKLGKAEHDFVVTNLWRHPPTTEDGDFTHNLSFAVKTIKHCERVLLLGSETSLTFLNRNASDVYGLWMRSDLLPDIAMMVAPSPASLIYGTVGEFVNALTKFVKSSKTTKGRLL